jgi:hypothetical protein
LSKNFQKVSRKLVVIGFRSRSCAEMRRCRCRCCCC